MNNETLTDLLEYLTALSKVQASGHYVNEEIKEVVQEVRHLLGLEKRKLNKLLDSRKLIFKAKLQGEPSFIQRVLFEAVFNSHEDAIDVHYDSMDKDDIEKAVLILDDMNQNIVVNVNKDFVRVLKV